MTNTTDTIGATIDADAKVMVNCDEPNCRHFESGHEVYTWDLASFIHERAAFGEVTVSRDPDHSFWNIEMNTSDEYTPSEAQELIDLLTAAVADANALNQARA